MYVAIFKQLVQAAGTPDEAIVGSTWPLSNDIQQAHVGITHCLYVNGVNAFSVNKRIFIFLWRFYRNVRAVNRPMTFGKPAMALKACLLLVIACWFSGNLIAVLASLHSAFVTAVMMRLMLA